MATRTCRARVSGCTGSNERLSSATRSRSSTCVVGGAQSFDCEREARATREGTLAIIARHRTDGPHQEPVSTRIEIGAATVRVEVRSRGKWQTVMAEQFQVRRLGSTAVLHGIHDGWDNDGRYVESWVFTWWYAAAGDLVRATAPANTTP
jgi:hypothetical protein